MKKRSVKAVAAVMAVLMIGTFAACKKDPEDAVGSTSEENSSRNAWLDETLATEAALSEIVTDENGETRVIEYETDASGTVVTAPDGTKVTKPAATEAAATTAASTTATQPQGGGSGGNSGGNTTTTRPPITTAPPPVDPPKPTDPPPPPTNPPAAIELTAAQKEAMINDLMAYARGVGYTEVYRDDVGDNVYTQYWDVTPQNYDKGLNQMKAFLQELCGGQFAPSKYVNFQWGVKEPNTLYIYME